MCFKHIRFQKLTQIFTLVLFIFIILGAGEAFAVNQLIAQGYPANSSLQPGMIVQLNSANPNQVTTAKLSDVNRMLGVVISGNEAALTLSQPTSSNEVYVSNSGQHEVLVSNQNGPISVGNYISVSSIAGIGMKAGSNESEVLGQAAGNFDGTHNVLSSSELSEGGGKKAKVSFGLIPVDLNIASNPLDEGTKGVPALLSNIAKYATNKTVSAAQIYLALVCIIAGLIVAITIVYSAIKNGFISIGRNPLAKKSITLNLFRVVIISLVVFGAALSAAYLIITR